MTNKKRKEKQMISYKVTKNIVKDEAD